MMLLRDGRIGVIDWDNGRLDPATHRFFISLLSAAMGDEVAGIVVTRHIIDTYGPAIGVAVGMTDDELTGFIRSIMESALTRPFGEVSLAGIMQTIQLEVATYRALRRRPAASGPSHRLRSQRRICRLADEPGGLMSDFDRGTLSLLAKQLMHFPSATADVRLRNPHPERP